MVPLRPFVVSVHGSVYAIVREVSRGVFGHWYVFVIDDATMGDERRLEVVLELQYHLEIELWVIPDL